MASGSLCCSEKKIVSKKFEKSESRAQAIKPPKPEVPEPFQVIVNGKAVNKPHIAQRSTLTGKIEWTEQTSK